MFTGLIEEKGRIVAVEGSGRSRHLRVGARLVLDGLHEGDSIAVNGVCLTVVRFDGDSFTADVIPETYNKTNLSELRPGAVVNLERTMAVGDRFGGHIVQGHVDGTGAIVALEREEIAVWMTVSAGPEILRYMVPKGSITIDGISLTVVAVAADRFQVSLIPHTVAVTNMQQHKVGDRVNLEVDILAKYVERLLTGVPGAEARRPGGGLTEALLKEHGF